MSIDKIIKFCQTGNMKDGTPETRQQVILTAAMSTFATYGFRKTSMDDIARAANMSRPALYQHYRNKEDIFRSITELFYENAAQAVTAALSEPGSPKELLTQAFLAQGGDAMERLLTSPHGMELIDSGKATAGDVVEAGEARMAAVYSDWLDGLYEKAGVAPEMATSDMAASMMAALHGIKMNAKDFAGYRTGLRALGALVGAGLAHL